MIIEVSDPGDARLGDYVALREATLRRSLESEHGLFIAEGIKVIERAIGAGYRPRSFLLAARWLDQLAPVLARCHDVPVYVVSEALAEQVTGFHVHRGALASLHREIRHTADDLIQRARRLVVIEDVVDHTNVGAILRCAAGLGWDGALLAPRAADPLYRRAIKVSMGAVFSLPWARLDDWADAVPMLQRAGWRTVALALTYDAVDLADVSAGPGQRLALLVGTEGHGLSRRWIEASDVVAAIPMAHGIDSLNVAAAAAIGCYALASRTIEDTGQSLG